MHNLPPLISEAFLGEVTSACVYVSVLPGLSIYFSPGLPGWFGSDSLVLYWFCVLATLALSSDWPLRLDIGSVGLATVSICFSKIGLDLLDTGCIGFATLAHGSAGIL